MEHDCVSGDVAVIKDGLEERLSEWHYDGQPTQGWEIHTQYSAVEVARRVNDYVARTAVTTPGRSVDNDLVG